MHRFGTWLLTLGVVLLSVGFSVVAEAQLRKLGPRLEEVLRQATTDLIPVAVTPNSGAILDLLAPSWRTDTPTLGGGTTGFGGTSATSPYTAAQAALLPQAQPALSRLSGAYQDNHETSGTTCADQVIRRPTANKAPYLRVGNDHVFPSKDAYETNE
jgi:subtilisin family serine protease